MKKWQQLTLIVGVFLAAYYIPFGTPRVDAAVLESFKMLQEYARLHVLTCLVPAFFIAGAIANFVSQGAVLKYLGRDAKKTIAYSVAAVSGTILAVCSCTVLPLFSGIYKRGAGLGPAVAFLYSGPAINALAIILTARILGWQLGLARALGAVLFSVVIGLIMAAVFKTDEEKRAAKGFRVTEEEQPRTLGQNIVFMATLVFILIFASWGRPSEPVGFWNMVYGIKWILTLIFLGLLAVILWRWFENYEIKSWLDATWGFAVQILPLLFGGVLAAGFLMGRPGSNAGLIPAEYVAYLVGGNSLFSNFFASIVGAFMYFATLTEVPILQGLIGSGMGQGPALALLLAGPALSLPNMLVIRSVIGTKKTLVYVSLVVVMATITGMIFGSIVS
ncbi:MAG: uncharacterized protein PWQ82_1048 [Thermosediminibacterales bacterium]|nr:uncharacterized protein [Thermosediminibacterales bacterium]MDK2836303.1 uncharacterized protein [Thermosediminibacterales bacterium]